MEEEAVLDMDNGGVADEHVVDNVSTFLFGLISG